VTNVGTPGLTIQRFRIFLEGFMRRSPWTDLSLFPVAVLLASLFSACTGTIAEQAPDKPGILDPEGVPLPASPGKQPAAPVPSPANPDRMPAPLLDSPGKLPLRRLTREEYRNTIRDLFGGDILSPGADFPVDATGDSGFYTPGSVSSLEVSYLMEGGENVGNQIAARIPRLTPCDPTAVGEEACARQFVISFGRRTYRRPLQQDEVETLVSFFKQAKTTLQYSFNDSVRVVVQAMLQSPNFLYHHESAAPPVLEGGLVKFDSHRMASRLSYFLWTSMPDDALFAAADAGRLQAVADIEREARRMLKSSKFRDALASFHFQWLGISELAGVSKDPKLFPKFGPTLTSAMQRETLEFVADTISSDGRLATLLTATHSFINSDLASLYGITPSQGASARQDLFPRVSLDPAQRSGLLTQASFLALGATSVNPLPPLRGLRILERFLCRTVPPPPDDVPDAPAPQATVTNRERFEEHAKNGCAAACHGLIDPLGYAFENYDAVGAYRHLDGGKEVNASGTLQLASDGQPVPFKNAIELSRILSENDEVRRCVGTQWLRFALGREDVPGDAASFAQAFAPFVASGADIREFLVQLTKGRSFLYRAPSDGEVLR
jgi:hypothetical protein